MELKYIGTGRSIPAAGIVLLVLLILLLSTPVGFGAEVTASGSCGPSASWTLTKDGVLTVSGTGEMEDFNTAVDGNNYTWIGADKFPPWYGYLPDIRKVVVQKGITKVSHGSGHIGRGRELRISHLPGLHRAEGSRTAG